MAKKRKKSKWTMAKIRKFSILQLNHMTTEQMAELAQYMTENVRRRYAQFTKAGTRGYAQEQYEEQITGWSERLDVGYIRGGSITDPNGDLLPPFSYRKNPQNLLRGYILITKDFLTAKSSTVKGWREIGLAQDRRLFGKRISTKDGGYKYISKKGMHRMTDNERILFWKVYDEMYKSGWASVNSYSSDSQRAFASKWVDVAEDFQNLDFEEVYERMKEAMSEKPENYPEHTEGNAGDPFQQEDAFA